MSGGAAPTGRAVFTTGANSGIGLATVIELARRGYRSIGSVRSTEKADAVAKAAAGAGVEVETVLLDVTDASGCERALQGLSLYGLVNNAGYGQTGAIEDVSDDEVRALLETLVLAPMRLARLVLPAMRDQGGGRIVNVSSIAGRATAPFAGWYAAAKHALEAATDALRVEVARDGVKVALVEPGGFRTAIWEDSERDVAGRAGSPYDRAYQRSLLAMKLGAPFMGDPARAARAIAGAIGARSPRPRYLVGYDAQALALLDSLAPTAVKDRVMRLGLGL
ncbi:MAG TPA: SDR family NAD(P)-dependent oxidoreductase [Acidimicrobiales bacterium]|nr:SDR family NAD(P)-dependent oxidoreductase [Acidimicrobiales bacterium]